MKIKLKNYSIGFWRIFDPIFNNYSYFLYYNKKTWNMIYYEGKIAAEKF